MKKIRTSMLVFLTHKIGLPYFKLFRKPTEFPYSKSDLRTLPQGTVGYALHLFLQENNLELLPYYERHDIKHVLFGYPPTEEGEVSLQCFMLANGRITLPVFITVLFGIITMPNYWQMFWRAFKRGKKCTNTKNINWFSLLPENLNSVQTKLFKI